MDDPQSENPEPEPQNQDLFEQIQEGIKRGNTGRDLDEEDANSGQEDEDSSGQEDEDDYEGDTDGASSESGSEAEPEQEEFENYVPVSLGKKLQRQHGVPQDWKRCTEIPGTGESIHILCPNNYVFTKKEESFKKGDKFHGWKLRCQESRRGIKSCPVTWLVRTHPEEVVTRGELQPLYYKDDEVPKPDAHTHLPDMENMIKR